MSRNESFDRGRFGHLGDPAHLEPRTFGPGGKYTTKPVTTFGHSPYDVKSVDRVEAVHTNSGRRIGYISLMDPMSNGPDGEPLRHVQGSPDPTKSAIYKAQVTPNMQRKGIGSAMLAHARDLRPGLQHSGPQALSPEGASWAKKNAR